MYAISPESTFLLGVFFFSRIVCADLYTYVHRQQRTDKTRGKWLYEMRQGQREIGTTEKLL